MRRASALVLGLLLAFGLSACGGGAKSTAKPPSKKQYCHAVGALAGARPSPQVLIRRVQAASNVAPGSVARQWHDIADAVQKYVGAAVRSRLDPAHPPEGLTSAETVALNRRLEANAYQTNVGPLSREIRLVQREVRADCGTRTSL